MKPWREAASIILCARHQRNFDKTLPSTAVSTLIKSSEL